MQDGKGAEEQAEASRLELYEDYLKCYSDWCPGDQPCHDVQLRKKVAQYLLREPTPPGTFTVFPFYQAVAEACDPVSTDCRTHLTAFIRATELLETLCVNLFLQPWRKEFKTLKTFTGPFVYCLLPVLSSSTIQSVLASIGYLPHSDSPQSEFRLCEDANPGRAILVGFELLLARLECYHLLEVLDKDQLGPKEWLEVLQRRAGPTKVEETPGKERKMGPKEEEKEKDKGDRKEVLLYSVPGPGARDRCIPPRIPIADQFIMEMQRTYPDLAFRGRPLVPDKPHRAKRIRGSSKDSDTASGHYSDNNKASEIPKRQGIKDIRATSKMICSKIDGSKADNMLGDEGRSSGFNDHRSSCRDTDGNRVDVELSGPQAISLQMGLKPGLSPPTVDPSAAGIPKKRLSRPALPTLSSMDEERELRGLAERMKHQLHVQETSEEVIRKEENKRGENTNKERRENERKISTNGEVEEQNLMKPVVETGPALSYDAGGGSTEGQEKEIEEVEFSEGEEEQLAQNFVFV
ncbi:spermatogenesis-associated protein 2 [Limanda limanda]|uniref:spermatogenesis-associated protein 2 n=1 Tax=Limanda limanda TaxID=27771 RepID=UPI0029C6EEC5|nr:spermatogenesis-associated protein 2 [Limanda limanda]